MPQCPNCGSHSTIRRGSGTRPGSHRFQCKDCHKYFSANGGVRKTKILSLDVETLPGVYYAFSPWNQNLKRHLMIKDWSLLSYSAKWIGDDRVVGRVLTPEETITRDDRRLANEIWHLLDQADIAITHNGKRFDIKKINTRFWKHRLHKPSSYKVIDTLVTAKAVFGLTYNSMDFIAEFIEADQKLDTNFVLWRLADQGNLPALEEMLEYNMQDVRTQEQIYMEMREWIPNHPNLALYENRPYACPVCVSKQYKRIGIHYANKKRYAEYRCEHCQSVWHNTKAIKG